MTAGMQALTLALVLSLAGNAGLGLAWLHARDAATRTLGEHDSARAGASACSDGVADLRGLADERHRLPTDFNPKFLAMPVSVSPKRSR